MILAKYKNELGEWFSTWSLWITLTGIPWIMKGRSPLVWPNVWGVLEWLTWSAAGAAIVQLGSGQLTRELPERGRLEDALLLLKMFAYWLIGVAIFFTIAAGRIYLYVWDASPDLRLFVDTLGRQKAIKLSVVVFVGLNAFGLLTFVCRMIAVLVRRYDGSETLNQR